MIYHDQYAKDDHEDYPKNRGERCRNCGMYWDGHSGWRCNDISDHHIEFHKLNPAYRYVTASMLVSIHLDPDTWNRASVKRLADMVGIAKLNEQTCPPKTEEPKPVDLTDWRAWAHNKEGDCACGIKREQCEFH